MFVLRIAGRIGGSGCGVMSVRAVLGMRSVGLHLQGQRAVSCLQSADTVRVQRRASTAAARQRPAQRRAL
uniref:Secreted protein n=1 Tax=Ascaris lumbricoides TaxID=6252 RepID=A0A0M3HSH1_ASCLU